MKEEKEALENLRDAYKQNPEDRDISLQLAQKYANLGWLNEAYSLYKKLADNYSSDFSILLAFGNLCFSKKNTEEALSVFKKITVLKPKRVEGWNNLGIVQITTKDFESAKKSFDNVLSIEPENYGALLNMGNYYNHVGNVDKSIELFKKVTEIRPYFTDAWFNLGNAYIASKLFDKAIEVLKRALKYDRKFAPAFKNIGFSFEEKGEYPEAEEYYLKALEINKTDASLYVNIANVYSKQLKYDKAKDFFLRAVKLAPKEAAGWLGLRELSLKKGDIATYIKSTLAVLHRLDVETISESIHKLRSMGQYEDVGTLLKAVARLSLDNNEIEAERLLFLNRKNNDTVKTALLYKKLSGLNNASDHILNCLAEYCYAKADFDKVIEYINSQKVKNIFDMKLLWGSLIKKNELSLAEQLLENYLVDNQDCFEGWYYLSHIKMKLNYPKKAKDLFVRALETGFTDLDRLEEEPELKELFLSFSPNNL